MPGDTEKRVRLYAGVVVFMVALIMYTLTVNAWPFPGSSSRLIVSHMGLDAFPSFTHPLWGMVARGVGTVFSGSRVFALNLMSAVCGATCVFLLYWIVSTVSLALRRSESASVTAGVGAALYLMVSTPFWYVSSRAHTLAFDLLLLLGSIALLMLFVRGGDRRHIYGWAFLCGMGSLEFATMIPWIAAMTIVLVRFTNRETLSDRAVLPQVVCCFLAGLSLSALTIKGVSHMAGPGRSSFGYAYLSELLGGVHLFAWLYIVLVSLGTLALAVKVVLRPSASTKGRTMRGAYAVLCLVCAAHLYGLPTSLWYAFGEETLLVTPYVLIAISFGLVLSQGYEWVRQYAERSEDLFKCQRIQRYAFLVMAVVLGGAGVRTCSIVETASAATVERWAMTTLEHMGERTWLVTGGTLDDALLLAAHKLDRSLKIINLRKASSPVYRRYLADLFESPRYKGLAQVSPVALVREFIAKEFHAEEKMALMTMPELWTHADLRALPFMGLYLGLSPGVDVDLQALMKVHMWQWGRSLTSYRALRNRRDALAEYGSEICRDQSHSANELGVLMEAQERRAYAIKAYEVAVEFDFQNICASLNAKTLEGGLSSEEVDGIVLDDRVRNMGVPELFSMYGHVAQGETLRLLAASRGLSSVALADWSPELGPVRAKLRRGEPADAQRMLEALVAEEPDLPEAWAWLGFVAFTRGEQETVQLCVERMSARNEAWPLLLYVHGVQAHDEGEVERARVLFEKARVGGPSDVPVVEAQMKMALEENDSIRTRDLLTSLLSWDPGNAWGNFVLGTMQLHQRLYDQAEASFRASIDRKPLTGSLNSLAWTLHLRGAYDEALRFCAWSLQMNAESYATWDTYGVVLMKAGRTEEAERALVQARALAPMAQGPQIHLVELLIETERPEAAAILARRILDSDAAINSADKSELQKLVSAIL